MVHSVEQKEMWGLLCEVELPTKHLAQVSR